MRKARKLPPKKTPDYIGYLHSLLVGEQDTIRVSYADVSSLRALASRLKSKGYMYRTKVNKLDNTITVTRLK